ncbi:hypothetical protein [Rhodoblastus sp.]|uniref:hypothetical protein n=1 Tax=Rhodoblastus sp. TaxID=1962975 RepID=UPI003F989D01
MCSSFVLMTLVKENAAVPGCLEAAPSIAAPHSSTDLRAARLAKFEREQLIVDTLNRGVSVAELAARVAGGDRPYHEGHKANVKKVNRPMRQP